MANDTPQRVGEWAFMLFPAFALAGTVAGCFAVQSLFGIATCTVAGLCAAIPIVIAVQTVLLARHLRARMTPHGTPVVRNETPSAAGSHR